MPKWLRVSKGVAVNVAPYEQLRVIPELTGGSKDLYHIFGAPFDETQEGRLLCEGLSEEEAYSLLDQLTPAAHNYNVKISDRTFSAVLPERVDVTGVPNLVRIEDLDTPTAALVDTVEELKDLDAARITIRE